MIPGEYFIQDGEIELNQGRKSLTLTVANTGDRPIQVGSHYHFFETNPALQFDRKKARGMRLDIAAGTAVRFEPGQTRDVTLVALAGTRTVYGFRQDVMGKLERTGKLEKGKSQRIMTSGLAQVRPSRSQRRYRCWDQDQISTWCHAGSGFDTRPTLTLAISLIRQNQTRAIWKSEYCAHGATQAKACVCLVVQRSGDNIGDLLKPMPSI